MLTEKDNQIINIVSEKDKNISYLIDKLKEEHRFSISQISHEIRNPVTLINSSLQLIEQQHPEVKTFSFWKETMEDLAFLRTLLDELSSFNNGSLLHPEQKNLQDWIPNFFSSIKSLSAFSSLHLELKDNLPTVTWDCVKIRQVLNNLIRNSLEASPKNTPILLKVSFLDPLVEMVVKDYGCGIPSSVFSTLFEPFHTTKNTGTGLGLAICKRIIDSHHGTISISSKINRGTTVTIRIPQNPFCSCE